MLGPKGPSQDASKGQSRGVLVSITTYAVWRFIFIFIFIDLGIRWYQSACLMHLSACLNQSCMNCTSDDISQVQAGSELSFRKSLPCRSVYSRENTPSQDDGEPITENTETRYSRLRNPGPGRLREV